MFWTCALKLSVELAHPSPVQCTGATGPVEIDTVQAWPPSRTDRQSATDAWLAYPPTMYWIKTFVFFLDILNRPGSSFRLCITVEKRWREGNITTARLALVLAASRIRPSTWIQGSTWYKRWARKWIGFRGRHWGWWWRRSSKESDSLASASGVGDCAQSQKGRSSYRSSYNRWRWNEASDPAGCQWRYGCFLHVQPSWS